MIDLTLDGFSSTFRDVRVGRRFVTAVYMGAFVRIPRANATGQALVDAHERAVRRIPHTERTT